MNREELRVNLVRDNVPQYFYSLNGGLSNDTLCMSKTSTGWEVYYTERGEKFELKKFNSEAEACKHLYNEITTMMKHL